MDQANSITSDSKPCILVIEESRIFCSILSRVLESQGFRVAKVFSLDRALEEIARDCPDVVVLSLTRFRGEGVSMLSVLKEAYSELPLIVLGFQEDSRLSLECMRLGAADFLLLPLDLEDLIKSISRLISDK
ncbi:response regulator [Desulfonatronovibrio hydrogenovorans]|uniref:response regulator n=1 Tax=Desulfonatronovibrio hydrogenovorans TaxID=53245 RepID=UPI00048E8FC5|nr:response regulator [Desulfonatronovibrio hydrogenovorans]